MSENRVVVPTCLPMILCRCHRCASGRFRANGRFHATANRKGLDAWLLAPRTEYGDTTALTALESMNVRSVLPGLLNLLHDNNDATEPGPVAELLHPAPRRRGLGGSGRPDRPAWQSPYGPPSCRAHRGRWAPVPGFTGAQSAVRHGYLCGRCD